MLDNFFFFNCYNGKLKRDNRIQNCSKSRTKEYFAITCNYN